MPTEPQPNDALLSNKQSDLTEPCPHPTSYIPESHEAEDDDRPVGRILNRREVLALFGVGTAMLVGVESVRAQSGQTIFLPFVSTDAEAISTPTTVPTTVPTCVARPEVTEGPYFVDERLNRADIRSDPSTGVVREGALLSLTFNVSQLSNGTCTALIGAIVDVWHCDALGVYSDVSDPGFNTAGQKFLRGYLMTDAKGTATFTTIYPGWYSSRAVHIHFKIRTGFDASAYEFTSQLFFDDAFTDQVFTQQPYASKGQRDTLNSTDNIYRSQLLIDVTATDTGYAATFDVALDIS